MGDNTFVSLSEVNKLALDMISSEWWEKALANQCCDSSDFKQGAMWGAAMAIIYATAYSSKYYPTVLPKKDATEETGAEG